MKKWKIFLFFLIIITIALPVGVFTLNKLKNKTDSMADPTFSNADLSIKAVNYTQTEEGEKVWELKAQSARYFKKKKQIILEEVEAIFYSQPGEAIHLTGNQGKIMSDSKDIEIIGNVVAKSSKGYLLHTDSLKYISAQRKIFTSDHVKITGEKMRIEGDGLSMDLAGENLSILKNIKSSFKEMKLY
jgi:LPS export ABC transporter protein LptC